MIQQLSETQWQTYQREGYLRLGKCLTDKELADLQQRMDEIMLGKAALDYDHTFMQLDSIPGVSDEAGVGGSGHKGATLRYRKIQDLEFDPLFLRYMQRPLFQDICAKVYGESTPIACMRAMYLNKNVNEGTNPARRGARVLWHQDRWVNFDRDPLLTIWTAMSPVTVENGCVYITPRQHQTLINPSHSGGFLTDEQAETLVAEVEPIPLEMDAGEAVLLHNWMPHSSSSNHSPIDRRALSVCYMDAATVDWFQASRNGPEATHARLAWIRDNGGMTPPDMGKSYSLIFGEGALDPAQFSEDH